MLEKKDLESTPRYDMSHPMTILVKRELDSEHDDVDRLLSPIVQDMHSDTVDHSWFDGRSFIAADTFDVILSNVIRKRLLAPPLCALELTSKFMDKVLRMISRDCVSDAEEQERLLWHELDVFFETFSSKIVAMHCTSRGEQEECAALDEISSWLSSTAARVHCMTSQPVQHQAF